MGSWCPYRPLLSSPPALIGGFSAARYSGRRSLGGAVLATAGAWCARSWQRSSGPGAMGILLGTYLTAFGASHPLAKKIGAWPSVLLVTAAAAGTTYLVADRPTTPDLLV